MERHSRPLKPLSWYKSLSFSKERRSEGFFIVEGRRAVDQLLVFHPDKVEELLAVEGEALVDMTNDLPVRFISRDKFKSICSLKTPQGIAAVVKLPPDVFLSELPKAPGEKIVLLENIQDPGNVGSIIRTAAALGYNGCILSSQCADPFSPKAVQSTAGAVLSSWIRRTDRYLGMISELKDSGYELVSADLDGEERVDFRGLRKHILALGNEGAGLTDELLGLSTRKFRIPIFEHAVESLNVAASGAICMFMCSQHIALEQGAAPQE